MGHHTTRRAFRPFNRITASGFTGLSIIDGDSQEGTFLLIIMGVASVQNNKNKIKRKPVDFYEINNMKTKAETSLMQM